MRNRNMTASSLLKSNLGGSFFFEDCHVLSSPEWWRSQRRCRMPPRGQSTLDGPVLLIRRIGEAAHPGPPSEGDPELRRQRALHTCADAVQRCCHSAPARPRCATTKRTWTLPRPSPTRSAPQPLLRLREKMPLSHSREHWPQRRPVKRRQASHRQLSPEQLPAPADVEPLPWHDARPPSSLPGERNSWRYIPLLRVPSTTGDRGQGSVLVFGARVLAGDEAPPVLPSGLAQTLLAVAECEAHDALRFISAADRASAAALAAMPDAPLPLLAALLLCIAPDGYLTAAAQAAFLESYAGATAPAAAQSLANDARHELQPLAMPHARHTATSRGARRCSAVSALTNVSLPARQLPETTTPLPMRRQPKSPMRHGWPWTRCEPPCGQR